MEKTGVRPTDVWIKGYEGLYKISSNGYVYSYRFNKIKLIKNQILTKGYIGVRIYDSGGKGKTYKIHRLVAQHFLSNWNENLHVNHMSGIKEDNTVENLEMVTNKENMDHAIRLGLIKNVKGEEHGMSKLNNETVKRIRDTFRNENISFGDLAKLFSISKSQVWRVVRNESWI